MWDVIYGNAQGCKLRSIDCVAGINANRVDTDIDGVVRGLENMDAGASEGW